MGCRAQSARGVKGGGGADDLLHTQEERYSEKEELIALTHRTGQRRYFHARPYILVPDVTLTVGLYPQPKETGEVGRVLSSEWQGMRHQEIGNAQGWFYHKERLLVIWECFLNDHYRQEDPTKDELLKTVWTGWERFLLERLPGAKRIVTPSWEPDVPDQNTFQEFLSQRGYSQFNERAFGKNLVAKL